MNKKEKTEIDELKKYPGVRFIIQHGRLGLRIFLFGLLSAALIVILNKLIGYKFKDYIWSALMSVPVTLICMGIFSVLYEWSVRSTFMDAMRSANAAWNTGVTVFPTHKSAPDRAEVLKKATKSVKLMSTTFSRYFLSVGGLVEEKIEKGIKFYFIIYDPESKAIKEKAVEENAIIADFQDEIKSTCRRHLAPLVKKYPDNVFVKFCRFNTPFGITIIDDANIVLSLNIYGLSRSKNETPCLIIENKYDKESVFKLYESSFNSIWEKLDDSIPESLLYIFKEDIEKDDNNV